MKQSASTRHLSESLVVLIVVLLVSGMGFANEPGAVLQSKVIATAATSHHDGPSFVLAKATKHKKKKKKKKKKVSTKRTTKSNTPSPSSKSSASTPAPAKIPTKESGKASDAAAPAGSVWDDLTSPSWAGGSKDAKSGSSSTTSDSQPATSSNNETPAKDSSAQSSLSKAHSGRESRQRSSTPDLVRTPAILILGGGLGGRSLKFSGAPVETRGVRDMTLKSVIVAGAALEVYPASLIQFITSTPEILTHFGLRASYFKALNVNSQVGDHPDAKMPTTWREIEYDITARAVVFGAQVKASAGLLNSRLFVDTAKVPGLESELPSVTAMTIRVGGDLDIEIIDDFSISAGASFDKPYSMGRLTKRFFPKASGWGYDFRAGVSYALLSHLDVLVFARYGVVNYKLNPASDSTYTATKAVDSLFGVNGGLRAYW